MSLERLRQFIRQRIGSRSLFYRLTARMLTDSLTLWREGPATYWQLANLRAQTSQTKETGEAVEVHFRSLAHPIMLRPNTDDIGAVLNNIIRHEYGHVAPLKPPSILLDAGAYIGDTSIFFLNQYPNLRSIALEPNPESFSLAQRNLAPYGDRVELLPTALSTMVGTVSFGGREMGAQINEDGAHEVPTLSVPALLEQIPENRIDILKMDIEGAEMGILDSTVSAWLPKVGMLIIETHGPEIERKLIEVMEANGWRAERFRNLYYCQPAEPAV